MKKTMIALTLMMFVGSMSANVYAASTGTSTEVVKNGDEKKKAKKAKKGKKGCEKTGSSCCAGKKAA